MQNFTLWGFLTVIWVPLACLWYFGLYSLSLLQPEFVSIRMPQKYALKWSYRRPYDRVCVLRSILGPLRTGIMVALLLETSIYHKRERDSQFKSFFYFHFPFTYPNRSSGRMNIKPVMHSWSRATVKAKSPQISRFSLIVSTRYQNWPIISVHNFKTFYTLLCTLVLWLHFIQ